MIDLAPHHLEKIRTILGKHVPQCEVRAFGSRVDWTAKDYSDLDLAVVASGKLSDDTLRHLREAFEESDLPFRVEVLDWHAASPDFKKVIEREYEVVQKPRRDRTVGEWRDREWGQIAKLEYGKSLRGYEGVAGRYRVYGTNGPIGWHDEALCSHPGVIVGRKGAYRGIHYSPEPFFVIDTAFYLEPKEDIDLRWAYYALLTYDINGMDSGSAIPFTSRESFYRMPVRVPPLGEQRAIAHILGTLDDKIELNRRMNETLEAIARALFKSWFVDFDPVRAKAEGRDPGLPKPLADLFPDSFEDSELGQIPKGWNVEEIKARASRIQYGLTRSASDEPIGPHFLRITDIQGGRIDWSKVPYCGVTDEEKQKYQIRRGDIFVARTGASTGENTYVVEAPDAVFASYLVRFQFHDSSIARFVGEYVRTAAYFDYVEGTIGGSAQPNASAQVLASDLLGFPPIAIAKQFAKFVRPLDHMRARNEAQSSTLAAIRDVLLPKLTSGEIRVKE